MASVRKSLLISFAEKYTTMAIAFGSTMVLARLLTPEEIGVFSVGAAIVALAHTVRDFGTTNYLIQEKELTPERVRTAFTVTLIIGWTMAAVLAAAAVPIAHFYDQPGVRLVVWVLAVNFLLIPFSSVILALLRRDMNFAVVARINVASAVVHAATAITLAALGHGFMSLAWAGLAGTATTVAAALVLGPKTALHRLSLKEGRRIFAFGGRLSIASVVNEIGESAPGLVLGRVLGFGAVGFYSRAFGLASTFQASVASAIAPVALPYFAAENRAGASVAQSYGRGIAYMSAVAWPFFAFLAVTAEPAVAVLFGDQWGPAVPLVRILALGMAFHALTTVAGAAVIGLGGAREAMRAQILLQAIQLPALLVAAPFGLAAAVWAVALARVAGFAIYVAFLRTLTPLSPALHLPAFAQGAALAAAAAAPALAVAIVVEPGALPLLYLAVAAAGSGAAWLATALALRHPLAEEIVRVARRALPRAAGLPGQVRGG